MLESLEYSVWKFCSHAGSGPALRSSWERLEGQWMPGIQDPKSPLSPCSLSPPEWISIDKDEAGTKGKVPSVSRGSQEPR